MSRNDTQSEAATFDALYGAMNDDHSAGLVMEDADGNAVTVPDVCPDTFVIDDDYRLISAHAKTMTMFVRNEQSSRRWALV